MVVNLSSQSDAEELAKKVQTLIRPAPKNPGLYDLAGPTRICLKTIYMYQALKLGVLAFFSLQSCFRIWLLAP